MCQIFVCTEDRPTLETMRDAEHLNSDGAGVAWEESGGIRWEKGLDMDGVHDLLFKQEISLPYVVHFRSASQGGKDMLLTHPFPLNATAHTALSGKEKKGVLFHNGTWGMWDDKMLQYALSHPGLIPDGPWSDSRALAFLIANKGPAILKFMTWGQGRIAIFKPKNESGRRINLHGDWTKKEGWSRSAPLVSATKGRTWHGGGRCEVIDLRQHGGQGKLVMPAVTEEEEVDSTHFTTLELQEVLFPLRKALKGQVEVGSDLISTLWSGVMN